MPPPVTAGDFSSLISLKANYRIVFLFFQLLLIKEIFFLMNIYSPYPGSCVGYTSVITGGVASEST